MNGLTILLGCKYFKPSATESKKSFSFDLKLAIASRKCSVVTKIYQNMLLSKYDGLVIVFVSPFQPFLKNFNFLLFYHISSNCLNFTNG